MGDKSKRLADDARTRARIKHDRENPPPRFVVRCACCRQTSDQVKGLIEMGSFLACDQCIKLAYKAVVLRGW